ncbi:MAG TPA: SDR family NAD(P)-dependent oxidoreductase [Streptosporangiaceae bacterium]
MTDDALRGQIAVITGASRGIGRALVHGLRSAGAAVAAVARASADLDSLRQEGVLSLAADVRSAS